MLPLSRTGSGLHTPESAVLLIKACAQASALGFLLRSKDLRIQTVNSAYAQMSRLPAEEYSGRTSREVLGELAERVEPLLNAVLKSREAIHCNLMGRLRMRPDYAHFFVRYQPVLDINGNVQCIVSFVVETTIEKRIEEALRLLDVSKLPTREMQHWMLDLQHGLDMFDFALHQTCRLLIEPQQRSDRTFESLRYKVEALDNRVHVLRKLLHNQADWLKEAAGPTVVN